MFRFAFQVIGMFCLPLFLQAQGTEKPFSLHFQPVFQQQKIALDKPLKTSGGDSLALHELRFYLTNFVFLKNGAVVFAEKNSHHLLDLEDENSLVLKFQLPENAGFDSLKFDLGVDSLTNLSGAMGGDLDPTRGMFWTWQSGYINFKMEGFFEKCPARNHEFQFHLGGYLPPFPTAQKVFLPVLEKEKMRVDFDLASFFEKIDWPKKHNIMSPCAEAVENSRVLAKSFSVHAN